MLLAIDTATRAISLALHDGNTLLVEQTWHTGDHHTTELAPAIQTVLERGGITVGDLKALAVSTGPGSYTGLRVGVAFAKGLCSAAKLPLIGVSSLDTLAAGQPNFQSGHGLIVVVQAGRGRVVVKTYRWRKGRWSSHAEPQLMDWETLIASVDGPAYLTGEVSADGQEAIKAAQARNVPVTLAPAAYRLRRAGFLAEEAWTRLNEGKDKFDAAKLVPIYVQTKDTPTP